MTGPSRLRRRRRAVRAEPAAAIAADRLSRTYTARTGWTTAPTSTTAVDGVTFAIPRGTVFGLLGPNGAGKTTTIKMLSTLLVPTSGTATVAGFDVVRDDQRVRQQLGVVLGGDRGLYGRLSAADNLVYFGRLYGLRKAAARERAGRLLSLVDLADRADQRVETFSRGMKQRLHLAKALLHDPPVVLLDEPTIGLDPVAADSLRRAVLDLVPAHTVLLTTHDMNEADQLCSDIAIIDAGRIVARGSPEELKAAVGGRRRMVVATRRPLEPHRAAVDAVLLARPDVDRTALVAGRAGGSDLTIFCADPAALLPVVLALLQELRIELTDVHVFEPTLEDAYLAVAGRDFE